MSGGEKSPSGRVLKVHRLCSLWISLPRTKFWQRFYGEIGQAPLPLPTNKNEGVFGMFKTHLLGCFSFFYTKKKTKIMEFFKIREIGDVADRKTKQTYKQKNKINPNNQ